MIMSKTVKQVVDNYIVITDKYSRNDISKNYKVLDKKYFADVDGNIYKVDGKYVVLDYSIREKEIAKWLANTLGGTVYMIPRVNEPINIQTPDYLFKGEHWDLKEIFGDSKQVIYHAINRKKYQSNNFIFDISNSNLSFDMAQQQIIKLYNRKDTLFLNKVILKNGEKYIIYKRK